MIISIGLFKSGYNLVYIQSSQIVRTIVVNVLEFLKYLYDLRIQV